MEEQDAVRGTIGADTICQRGAPATPAGSSGGRLIPCPYIALVDGQARDQFCDVRDAVAAARSIHKQSPASDVVVTDTRTGRLKIEIDQEVGR
jgi:hypothetical protein